VRVVVTGGRGLIGRHAVDELVGAGHDVISIARPADASVEGLRTAQRELVGDAAEPELLRSAMAGADAVVHLAAIPAPVGHTAVELVAANTLTTMSVLEAAGESGVRGAVIASSVSILGMAWSAERMPPLRLPVDEDHPLRPTEGYALSKECDEACARMAALRWGLPVVALRFPFTQTADAIRARAADDSDAGRLALAKELWGYLDVRDAARAIRLSVEAAVRGALPGATVLNIIADDPLLDEPLEQLVRAAHPEYDGPVPARGGAYDIRRAEQSIGFRAERLVHNAY
jgi:nucleoside-diphosphate-sugar epimerase